MAPTTSATTASSTLSEKESVRMIQLRACFMRMACMVDPYPYAQTLARWEDGPGAVFDEMNLELIVREGEVLKSSTQGSLWSTLFRWRQRLHQPSSAEHPFQRHHALLDVSGASLPSSWVRGGLHFFKEQLKEDWAPAEWWLEVCVEAEAAAAKRAARKYPEGEEPQEEEVGRRATPWGMRVQDGTTAPTQSPHNSLELLHHVVEAHFRIDEYGAALIDHPSFQSALCRLPQLMRSFRLTRDLSRLLLLLHPPFPQPPPPFSLATPSTAAPSVQTHHGAPWAAGESPLTRASTLHLDKDRFYANIFRSEFGNPEWLRYLFTLLLGAVQQVHLKAPSSPSDLEAARERSFAARQILEWAVGEDTCAVFLPFLALLFIQKLVSQRFPEEKLRDLIEAAENARVPPSYATIEPLLRFLCEEIPSFLAHLQPLAVEVECAELYTSVVLLQLFAVPPAQRLSTAAAAMHTTNTTTVGEDISGGRYSSEGGFSRASPPPSLPHASPPSLTSGVHKVSSVLTTRSVEWSMQPPTLLCRILRAVLGPLLRAHLTGTPIEGGSAKPSAAGVLIRQVAAAVSSFVLPVRTRLRRWTLLGLGNQPMVPCRLGHDAFQLAMREEIEELLRESTGNSVAQAVPAGKKERLENRLGRLLPVLLAFEQRLWSLVDASHVVEGGGAEDASPSSSLAGSTSVLRESVERFYESLRTALLTLHPSAPSKFANLLVYAIHSAMHRLEGAPTTEEAVAAPRCSGPAFLLTRFEDVEAALRLSSCVDYGGFVELFKDLLQVRLSYYAKSHEEEASSPTYAAMDAQKVAWERRVLRYWAEVEAHRSTTTWKSCKPASDALEYFRVYYLSGSSLTPQASPLELIVSIRDWRVCGSLEAYRSLVSKPLESASPAHPLLLPQPPAVTQATAAFQGHFERVSHHRLRLIFEQSRGFAVFSMIFRPRHTDPRRPPLLTLTIHSTLLLYRVLLLFTHLKGAVARRGLLVREVSAALQATYSAGGAELFALDFPLRTPDGRKLWELLQTLVQPYGLLRCSGDEGDAKDSSPTPTAAESPLAWETQRFSFAYDAIQAKIEAANAVRQAGGGEEAMRLVLHIWPSPDAFFALTRGGGDGRRGGGAVVSSTSLPSSVLAFRLERLKAMMTQLIKQEGAMRHETLCEAVQSSLHRFAEGKCSSDPLLASPVTKIQLKLAIDQLIQKDIVCRSPEDPQVYVLKV